MIDYFPGMDPPMAAAWSGIILIFCVQLLIAVVLYRGARKQRQNPQTNSETVRVHSGMTSTIQASFSREDAVPIGLALNENGNLISCSTQPQDTPESIIPQEEEIIYTPPEKPKRVLEI